MKVYASEDMESGEHLFIAGRSANLQNYYGNQYGASWKTGTRSASIHRNYMSVDTCKICALGVSVKPELVKVQYLMRQT